MSVTVSQILKEKRVARDDQMSWRIGAYLADKYLKLEGSPVPKDNRPKSHAAGTHCMAIYPNSWRPIIEKAIDDYQFDIDRQEPLFGDDL